MDGFSQEYLERKLVPSLNLFGDCGAKSKVFKKLFLLLLGCVINSRYFLITTFIDKKNNDNNLINYKFSVVFHDLLLPLYQFVDFFSSKIAGLSFKEIDDGWFLRSLGKVIGRIWFDMNLKRW